MDEVSPEDAPDDGYLRVTRDEGSSVQAGAGGCSPGQREGLALLFSQGWIPVAIQESTHLRPPVSFFCLL